MHVHKADFNKLMDAGFKIYSLCIRSCVIRELQPDMSWRVIRRRKARHKLEAEFKEILQDDRCIGAW